jgi:hypothetical protein
VQAAALLLLAQLLAWPLPPPLLLLRVRWSTPVAWQAPAWLLLLLLPAWPSRAPLLPAWPSRAPLLPAWLPHWLPAWLWQRWRRRGRLRHTTEVGVGAGLTAV